MRTRRWNTTNLTVISALLLAALMVISCLSKSTGSSSSSSSSRRHRLATSFAFVPPMSMTRTRHICDRRVTSMSCECECDIDDVGTSSSTSSMSHRRHRPLPRHVAFICDGNSRWSKNGISSSCGDSMDGDVVVGTTLSSSSFSSFSIARSMMGHVAGANRVVDLIDSILSMREKERERRRLMRMRRWSRDNREIEHYDDDVSVEDYDDDALRCITIFAFSTENWSRPKYEIDAIYELIENMSRKYRLYDRSIKDGKVRIRILGNIDDDRIPNRTRDELRMLERTSDEACDLMNSRKTGRRRRGGTMTTTSLENDDNDDRDDDDDALTVCLAINYGGRADILRAATELARSIVDDAASESNPSVIDETEITKRLCTSNLPDVDLIIRTGGERRLSNFFLWEGAYAELYFCDTLWPDFDEVSINEALAWYGKRKRRFGGR